MLTLAIWCGCDHYSSSHTDGHKQVFTDTGSSTERRPTFLRDCRGINDNRKTNIDSARFVEITGSNDGSTKNLSEVRSMCPGAVEFYTSQTDPTMKPVKVTGCRDWRAVHNLRFQDRWLYGQCRDSFSFCYVLIQAPRDMILHARIQHLSQPVGEFPVGLHSSSSESKWNLYGFEKLQHVNYKCEVTEWVRFMRDTSLYLSSTNRLYLYYANRPPLNIQFEAVKPKLDVQYTSEHTGFVIPSYQEGFGVVCDQLRAPNGHVIVVSFEWTRCGMVVLATYMEHGSFQKTLRISAGSKSVMKILNTTCLDMCIYLRGSYFHRGSCFKMLFSFHREHRLLKQLSSGLYNCSVDDYWMFKQHLDCNLKEECEDGRDETVHCSYSSPACQGWVAAHLKCYKMFTLASAIDVHKAKDTCQMYGFQLASIKTKQEAVGITRILRAFPYGASFGLTCGLRSNPVLYRWFLMWFDKTAIYNANHFKIVNDLNVTVNFDYNLGLSTTLEIRVQSIHGTSLRVICEKNTVQKDMFNSKSVEFPPDSMSDSVLHQTRQTLVTCSHGHVTHAFLSCDRKILCGEIVCHFHTGTLNFKEVISVAKHSIVAVAMYSCDSGHTEVSYSLLCDFRQDCADSSDESFCYHPPCTEFSCSNGQCVPMKKHCNRQADCMDDSDEEDCGLNGEQEPCVNNKEHQNQNASFLINFDGRGYFTQRAMNLTDPCPGTHYRCTKEWFYCLPIYTRCNGVFDCIFQEDERDCEGWTCPGLYRCRDSTVCVHADHMCDGWPQCPQRDDEWLCDMTCPAQCLCQGHAFLCPQPFSAHLFPQLRYLDARGSGMAPSDLRNNTYIVRLSLAHCSVRVLHDINFPNLQFLDLSHNKITNFATDVFALMEKLETLILKWNPLASAIANPSSPLKNLRKLDLSGTSLDVLVTDLLSSTPGIQHINISFSAEQTIHHHGFQMVPHLKRLDVRGTTISGFLLNMFRGLHTMDVIYASYYRLCCKEILPKVIPQPQCLAP